MQIKYLTGIILGLMLLSASCSDSGREVVRSFYYWKSELRPADVDTAFLQRQEVRRLYVRLLDVNWQDKQGAVPASVPVVTPTAVPAEIELVPVVYIVNSVFLHLQSESALEVLADKVIRKVEATTKDSTMHWADEFQIDCDWSEKTKDAYFLFLQKIKTKTGSGVLSATIRLHQYKYRDKTGIPPVDRGMLMLYNVLNVRDYQSENSIFEKGEIEKYIADMPPYPLPLDMVLPLFSWGVVYRKERFFVLLNNLRQKDLENTAFLQKNDYFWKVVRDTVFRKTYLRYGDEIKIEAAEEKDIMEVISTVRRLPVGDTLYLAFYHLDSEILGNYEDAFFKKAWEYLE